MPPLPNKPSQRGAQLKHRNNFTFYLYTEVRKFRVRDRTGKGGHHPERNNNDLY